MMTTDRRELLTIVVPVYNEAATVGHVLDRLLSIALPIDREIIVVDDGSTDGTGDVLSRYRGIGGVSVILAAANGGKGSAVRLGLARAAGTIVAIQDADLELDPSQLALLVEPILRQEAQVVYGSRFLAGRPDAPWLTVAANRVLTAVTNLLYRSSLTDMETCYKVMRTEVAKSLDLEANRFDLEPEITAKILLQGHRIMELPIRFQARSRSAGKKIRWRDGTQALAVLAGLWWRARAKGGGRTRNGTLIGLLTAVLAFAIGAWWNTFAAGGSDSHCYLGQARLFAQGRTSLREPLSLDVAWPAADLTFTPAGFIPSPVEKGASAPICSAGLSIAMAPLLFLEPLSKTWSERIAFLIVPVMGALAVWLTFVIGRRLGGPLVGVLSASLLVCDPIFLYQIVQPMSDVPAAALWLAVVVAVTGRSPGSALSGGLAGSLAIMTRPNLAPLAAVVALYVAASAYQQEGGPLAAFEQTVAFGLGMVPGAIAVAGFQHAMYGSPLQSGYGDAARLFAIAHIVPNLRRYLGWLLEVHGPLLGLGLLAPFVRRASNDRRNASIAVLLLALAATTLACYLPYLVFDRWWYIRFLLPAIPLLIVLTVLVVHRALALRPGLDRVRAPVLVLGVALLGVSWVKVADDRLAFTLWQLERHFVDAGHYAARLPKNAVVLTVKDSGSVRFYATHPTVAWDVLEPDRLDSALETLRQKGRKPYILIEADEEQPFKARFAGRSALASLDWPPVAQIGTSIRVYDPDDRRRYLAGDSVASERLWSPVGRPR